MKKNMNLIVKAAALVGSVAATKSSLRNAYAASPIALKCVDSISYLKSTDGKDVVIVGTAHISEESVEQVKSTIRQSQPDVVMIELDTKRTGLSSKSLDEIHAAGFDLPPPINVENSKYISSSSSLLSLGIQSNEIEKTSQNNWISGFANTVKGWATQQAGSLVGKALSQFYKSVEKLGVKAGGEFAAAIAEAKAMNPPARVLLGDRDVDITLQRLATALSQTDPQRFEVLSNRLVASEKKLGVTLEEDPQSLDKTSLLKFVEGLKQRRLLEEVMKIFKEEVPLIYAALIGERDEYLATSIATSKAKTLVAVVGMAHMIGMEKTLIEKFGYRLLKVC